MLGVAVSVVPFAVIALFLVLASSYPRLSASSSDAAFWARVGAVGLVLVEVVYLTRTLFELVLIANIETSQRSRAWSKRSGDSKAQG